MAAILSIVETCRRLNIPVRDYLTAVLPGLANKSIQRLPELTPTAWSPSIPDPSTMRSSNGYHKDIMLPLIAKTEGDRKRLLMKQAFGSIVRIAGRYASEMSPTEQSEMDAVFAEKVEA